MRRAKFLRTSSFRLTLLYAALFLLSVLVLFGVTYWAAADYAAQDETNEILGEYAAIRDEARLAGETLLPAIIANHLRERKDVRAVYLLLDAQGRKQAGNIDPVPRTPGVTMLHVVVDGRGREVRAYGHALPGGGYLLVGQDTFTLHELEEVIVRAFGAGLLVTLFLAVLGGAVISSVVLRRVESVGRTAHAIMTGKLNERVPIRGSDDEFDALGRSVNAMLDRIEELMRGVRQISNDVAHDLRTPLTRLRQRLERARDRSRTTEELREILVGSIAQVDAILETFAALLRIAQIEAEAPGPEPGVVDVSSALNVIVEDFAPAAEDHGHSLVADIEPGVAVTGDRELFTQMIVNLVDNAIRHSPAGTRILVAVRATGMGCEVAVADTGPGIPLDERDRVLQPFYRLEKSRTTNGSGLGLSLVAAIAKRHRAELSLSDNNPGLRVALRFPSAA